MARNQFATFLIICPTSFFLGMLFTNWSFDYHTLWTHAVPNESLLQSIESHYRLLSASPPLLPRVLNSIILLGLSGFLAKLAIYTPSESNYLFDGASLVLYLIGFVMYATNIVQGVKIVERGEYGRPEEGGVGRLDTLKVMAATQTMMALVFCGVLVLQAGQWYAEGKEQEEIKQEIKQEIKRERTWGRGGTESEKRS